MKKEDIENIVITDDLDKSVLYDLSDRIFELRDELSLDIISRNIIDRFKNPATYETPNYVTKFKQSYQYYKNLNSFENDIEILNGSLQELSEIVLANLNTYFNVSLGEEIDSDLTLDIEEYLDKIETLYTFFIVRRYSNIKDYFKSKLITNKMRFIDKYKAALDDKNYDLFLAQDKNKYKDVSNAIIIHFISDIILDIRSEIESAYSLFKEIVNLDLYEEYNNKMNNLIINYGNDLVILDDKAAIDSYLSILDNEEFFITLRNDLLSNFLIDAQLS